MRYFSEREGGRAPRDSEDIGGPARDGIRALIMARVQDGSFGATFRQNCPDSPIAIGTDETSFRNALRAYNPGPSDWPWDNGADWIGSSETPPTLQILDTIEFCWEHIGRPIPLDYHKFSKHYHLAFDRDAGREEFRSAIEDIFRRNGIAYELTTDGRIERLPSPVFQRVVTKFDFNTGDGEFDRLLSTAQSKFLTPDLEKRREALEALWDAWERLKTLGPRADKKAQVETMLDVTAGNNSPRFRSVLEQEASSLTRVGNTLGIRHAEVDQEKIVRSEHVDYLFYRLFSLIWLILRLK